MTNSRLHGKANQIFRPVTMFDFGIDGEVEFKDNDGRASGKRIYIQLKSGDGTIRWMNVTRSLKSRKNKQSRQIVFEGHKLDMNAVWKVRDEFFSAAKTRK